VISDETPGFDGPLAGILAAMRIASQPLLLVAPCDTPLLATEHFQRLLDGMKFNADAAIAFDGERLHPVMMVVKTAKQENLAAYLESGERKMQTWLHQLNTHRVDFSDAPQIFANINTLSELQALEAGASLDVSD
jgi:molybdopterin-guanine dinucleotide biosynthesis protein A